MDTQKVGRRGALLLLVLGVLTLFLLMGTMMLTLATRTRSTARAFAVATTGQAARPLLARRQLEQALLALIRGGPDIAAAGLSESLLADMYGAEPPLEGQVTSLVVHGALLEATVQMSNSAVRAADLYGRVITFKPTPESGDAMTSLRILRANGAGTFTCWMSRLQSNSELILPAVPCNVLVNQPAFRTEAYDAYDEQNEWLTQVALQDGVVSGVPRSAFSKTKVRVPVQFTDIDKVADVSVRVDDRVAIGQQLMSFDTTASSQRALFSPASGTVVEICVARGDSAVPGNLVMVIESLPQVDNDNDGVKDGVWLNDISGSVQAPGGGYFKFDASYLVLDLDGRVNVNAHGGRTSIDFPPQCLACKGTGKVNNANCKDCAGTGTGTWWRTSPDCPVGGGYGAVDVDASLVFVNPVAYDPSTFDFPWASDSWRRIIGSTSGPLVNTTATMSQRRPVPLVGPTEGRYGVMAMPGISETNDRLSERNESLYNTGSNALLGVSGSNLLVDLKCMVKADLDTADTARTPTAVPKLICYCPDWSRAGFVDDPYEMRLDIDAPRPAELRSSGNGQPSIDNPFTPAELETVLRQFDTDASTLAQRLAVVLDGASQRSRMLVTTDSWDTPGLTGSVAKQVADYLAGVTCDPATIMSPDVLAGLRFDINRPFPTDDASTVTVNEETAAKEDFCKHLYTLLVAIDSPLDGNGKPKTTGAKRARQLAQWAVNILDYRDVDSGFTRFQYDTKPQDGWGEGTTGWQSSNVVWGVERPELVIAQTLGWYEPSVSNKGELFVTLYRPWEVRRVQASGTTGSELLAGTSIDPCLTPDGKQDLLDLRKTLEVFADSPTKPNGARDTGEVFVDANGNNAYDRGAPIWRLKFDVNKTFNTGTSAYAKYARFDVPASRPTLTANECAPSKNYSQAPLLIGTGSSVVVRPSNTSGQSVQPAKEVLSCEVDQGCPFRILHSGTDEPDKPVYLQRIADLTKPLNEGEPFMDTNQNEWCDAAEEYTDANGNGTYDAGELFDDANANGTWDGGESYTDTDRDGTWDAPLNPYVSVDRMNVKLINRSGNTTANNWRSWQRGRPDKAGGVTPSFWEEPVTFDNLSPSPGRGPELAPPTAGLRDWFQWPNRPFIGNAELALVPQGQGFAMFSGYDVPKRQRKSDPFWGYLLPDERVLDATIVPSRFAGSQITVDPVGLGPVGMDKIPFNQLSRWREPGRVNLNTIVPNRNCADPQRDDVVWWATLGSDALVSLDEFRYEKDTNGSPDYKKPIRATSIRELLTLMQGRGIYLDDVLPTTGNKENSRKKNRNYVTNPVTAYSTAIRLSNVATIRSHVFAVWVTLRVRDTSPGGVTSYHRAFAIVDRSRPVGFDDGQDLNVRDTIRVLRFLD